MSPYTGGNDVGNEIFIDDMGADFNFTPQVGLHDSSKNDTVTAGLTIAT